MNRIKNINLFLFDMDGTLYIGERLYDFTKELLNTIKAQGKRGPLARRAKQRKGKSARGRTEKRQPPFPFRSLLKSEPAAPFGKAPTVPTRPKRPPL